jgi:hypothetical protein
VVVVVVMAIMPVVAIVMRIDDGRWRGLVLGVALVDAEHTFDAADDAADRAADHGAERTGNAVTFNEAVSSPTRDAAGGFLGLCGKGKSEGREAGSDEQFHFHVVSLVPSVCDPPRPMTAQQGHQVA